MMLEAKRETMRKRQEIRKNWPEVVSEALKDKVAQIFIEETSSGSLSTFTCAAEMYNASKHKLLLSEADLDLFKNPVNAGNLPCPYNNGLLKDIFIDPLGISSDEVRL
jgi:hypothetical protein